MFHPCDIDGPTVTVQRLEWLRGNGWLPLSEWPVDQPTLQVIDRVAAGQTQTNPLLAERLVEAAGFSVEEGRVIRRLGPSLITMWHEEGVAIQDVVKMPIIVSYDGLIWGWSLPLWYWAKDHMVLERFGYRRYRRWFRVRTGRLWVATSQDYAWIRGKVSKYGKVFDRAEPAPEPGLFTHKQWVRPTFW